MQNERNKRSSVSLLLTPQPLQVFISKGVCSVASSVAHRGLRSLHSGQERGFPPPRSLPPAFPLRRPLPHPGPNSSIKQVRGVDGAGVGDEGQAERSASTFQLFSRSVQSGKLGKHQGSRAESGVGGVRGRQRVPGGCPHSLQNTAVFLLARGRQRPGPGRSGVCVSGFPRKGLRSGSGCRCAGRWGRWSGNETPGLLC